MIDWPGVVNYDGDDELSFVGSDSEWEREARSGVFKREDRLIDSRGRIFRLAADGSETVTPADTEKVLSVDEMTRLVQAHAAQAGEFCATKMILGSVAEGIAFIGEMYKK